MPVSFHKEKIEFQLPDEQTLNIWLNEIVKSKGKSITQITYIFCSDEYLLNINQTYLSHDYYTDIITFPYKQGTDIESDIFISIDRVKENAITFASNFERELLRVMAHGVLHLLGYKDKTEDDKMLMQEQENLAIDMFEKINRAQ